MSSDPTSRSYDMDELDAGAELPRLQQQARVALELELEALRALNLPTDATIADVGCGPGFMSCQIAKLVPNGRVIGIDADPALLKQAEASAAAQVRPPEADGGSSTLVSNKNTPTRNPNHLRFGGHSRTWLQS